MSYGPNNPYASPGMTITCPYCQMQMTVAPSQSGQIADCVRCTGKFQIPVATAYTSTGSGSYNPSVQEFASKKIAAGICGILLGGLGVHKFILGFNSAGAIMLAVYILGAVTGMCFFIPFLASVAMWGIGVVEGIIYLTKSDEEFYQLYAVQKKEWF